MLGVLDLWSTFKTCEYKDHDDFGSLPRDLIPSALHYKCHIGNQEGLGQNWCVECMLGRRDHDADRGDKWFEYHMILMPLEYVKRRNWQIKERDPTTIDNRTRGSNIFASAKRAAIKNLKYAKKDPGQHHLYTHYSPILYALEILRILRIDVACVGIAGILKCADCGNPCDHLQHDHLWDPDADKKSPMELVENLRMAICKRDNVLSRSVLDGWVAGRYIYPGILATDSMEEFIEILGKYLNDEIVDKRISDSLRQKFFAFWSTRDPSKPKQDVVDQFKKDREYQSLVQTTKRCYLSGQIRQTQLSLACEHNHDTGCLRGLVNCQLNWRLPESAKTPEGREQLLVTGKNLDKRYLRDALLYILQMNPWLLDIGNRLSQKYGNGTTWNRESLGLSSSEKSPTMIHPKVTDLQYNLTELIGLLAPEGHSINAKDFLEERNAAKKLRNFTKDDASDSENMDDDDDSDSEFEDGDDDDDILGKTNASSHSLQSGSFD